MDTQRTDQSGYSGYTSSTSTPSASVTATVAFPNGQRQESARSRSPTGTSVFAGSEAVQRQVIRSLSPPMQRTSNQRVVSPARHAGSPGVVHTSPPREPIAYAEPILLHASPPRDERAVLCTSPSREAQPRIITMAAPGSPSTCPQCGSPTTSPSASPSLGPVAAPEVLYEAVRVPTTEVLHLTLEEYFLHHCPEKLTNIYDPQQFAEQLLQRGPKVEIPVWIPTEVPVAIEGQHSVLQEIQEIPYTVDIDVFEEEEIVKIVEEVHEEIVEVPHEVIIDKIVEIEEVEFTQVEVEKVVEVIVERIVEVPVEKIIEVNRDVLVQEDEHVPYKVIHERAVEVPKERVIETVVERVVTKVVEVPYQRMVTKFVETPIEKVLEQVHERVIDKIIEIEQEEITEEIHEKIQYKEEVVYKDRLVYNESVVEKTITRPGPVVEVESINYVTSSSMPPAPSAGSSPSKTKASNSNRSQKTASASSTSSQKKSDSSSARHQNMAASSSQSRASSSQLQAPPASKKGAAPPAIDKAMTSPRVDDNYDYSSYDYSPSYDYTKYGTVSGSQYGSPTGSARAGAASISQEPKYDYDYTNYDSNASNYDFSNYGAGWEWAQHAAETSASDAGYGASNDTSYQSKS
mmetsp:Transcript_8226/g.14709  ORF Transcript_8226/g.14709 Transcript_8226/m.14709 type:complete len:631 (-) Transcript_8226:793-2685(-)